MEIKKFNSFIKNESYSRSTQDFMDSLANSPDIQTELKSILKLTLEKVFYSKNVNVNSENVLDLIKSNTTIDETNLLEFDLSTQLDICIYAQEIDSSKCPSVDWELLVQEISKCAINGLSYMFDSLVENVFIEKFNKFMVDNELEYENVRYVETFGNYAPFKVKPIENGEINQYRKLDGSYNVDEYIYRDNQLNIELYIIKKI